MNQPTAHSDRLRRFNAPQALIILGSAWVLAMGACLLWAVRHSAIAAAEGAPDA